MATRPRGWYKLRKIALGKMGYICYWCGRSLINGRDIPKNKRIRIKKHIILWRGDDKVKEGWLATLDHVKPRCRGGTNKEENIVPSCHECNQIRAKFMNKDWKRDNLSSRKKFILSCWTRKVKEHRASLAK